MKKKIFTSCLYIFCLFLLFGCCHENQNNGNSYSVLVLSDTHYDRRIYNNGTRIPSYWDSDTAKSYGMWDNGDDSISLDMLKFVSENKGDAKFILHAGDIVMGDADIPENSVKEMQDGIEMISGIIGLPIYATLDNHDLCRTMSYPDANRFPTYSPGMDDIGCTPTYKQREINANAVIDYMKNYAADNLNYADLSGRYFMTKVYNGDLYIFTQASDEGLAYLLTKLEKYDQGIRHTFVIMHIAPILGKNYKAEKPWQNDSFHYYRVNETGPHILTSRNPELQNKIMSILAAREAIILTGHKHYWEIIDAKFSNGVIHQMMTNVNDVSLKWLPCESWNDWKKHAESDPGTSFDNGGAEEIIGYQLWSDRGFAKLEISDSGVVAQIYSANSKKMIKSIKLK